MMRVLVPSEALPSGGWVAGQRIFLVEDEAHHLKVRRSKDGEEVEVLDGAGLRAGGVLRQSGKGWSVELESVARESRPPELTLAVAAGDRERFSWMVEKGVELGVTRILPFESARSSGVATRIRPAHLARLRRHAREALKQCGMTWAPDLEEPVSMDGLLSCAVTGTAWLADASGAAPAAELDDTPVTVVIGPEGGLTDGERSRIVAAGYLPRILGKGTLRFETAAVAAAAVIGAGRLRGKHA
jgi:16S rRNA (uracil1498-N3)-methyltransferase